MDLDAEYLPKVLESFSGYLALDEIYDGAVCILYAVDAKQGLRLAFRVLEEDPKKQDIVAFLTELRSLLDRHGCKVRGITTDGSPLYPKAIRTEFPEARHQICVFHVLRDLNRTAAAVLMQIRRGLKAEAGLPRRRGRPASTEAEEVARRKVLDAHRRALKNGRTLFVKKRLTKTDRRRLEDLYLLHPALASLRQLVETVHHLFDRRCTTSTAREKLERLRQTQMFEWFPALEPIRQKLMQPTLEQALECLNDKLLERTSNAVERSNRRHRKMQRSVYRVRSPRTIAGRIKLDMIRDLQIRERRPMVFNLHATRAAARAHEPINYNRWASMTARQRNRVA